MIGIRLVMGAYRSSLIPSLLNFAGIPSFKVRRLQQTLEYELNLAVTSLSSNFIHKLQNLLLLLESYYMLKTQEWLQKGERTSSPKSIFF